MNPYVRGTLFFLVFAGLATEGYFAARVLVRRLEIEKGFEKLAADSDAAMQQHSVQLREVRAARSDLHNLALTGWGRVWPFSMNGNINAINLTPGGRLTVNGLGRNQGLKPVTDASNNITAPGVVHMFAADGNNVIHYIGEFSANPSQLQDNQCSLEPNWGPTQQEIASWDFRGGVRFRSEVPPGDRIHFATANQSLRRTNQMSVETDAAIVQQQTLRDAAAEALAIRQRELIGDENGADVFRHPEYRIGLVAAISNLEDERNALQSAVDTLRRLVDAATETRTQLVEQLHQSVGAETIPPQLSSNE